MDNILLKFYLKVPTYNFQSSILNGDFINIPDPPKLRRTSIATYAQEYEPSYSIGRLCEMKFNNQLQMYDVKVFDYPIMLEDEENHGYNKEWINVKWKINKEVNKIHYYVTSYFNSPVEYIDIIGIDYLIQRSQFSPILFFCILKFKVLLLRKMKERYLKKMFNNYILKNILKFIYYTPVLINKS
tara:strand:+ start:2749 stop:3303 length:555 start_codon:yes stop_codon:yes gene_type:complete